MESGKNMNELSLTEFALVLVTRLKIGHKKAISLGIIPVVLRSVAEDHLPPNEPHPLEKWLTAGLGMRKFQVSLELLVAVESK